MPDCRAHPISARIESRQEAKLMGARFFLLVGLLMLLLAGSSSASAQPADHFPDTTEGIHVFNDQVDVHHLSDAQVQFAAGHYDGAQKLTLAGTRRLRAFNPDFTVLHYRLGLGLGYRVADENCHPGGEYIAYIDGDNWVQEWPIFRWCKDRLYHVNGQRCTGARGAGIWPTPIIRWRVVDGRNPAADRANENNGLQTVSACPTIWVPKLVPPLPEYDEGFEADWTRQIDDWMQWAIENWSLTR
jgi:hypothetical protein